MAKQWLSPADPGSLPPVVATLTLGSLGVALALGIWVLTPCPPPFLLIPAPVSITHQEGAWRNAGSGSEQPAEAGAPLGGAYHVASSTRASGIGSARPPEEGRNLPSGTPPRPREGSPRPGPAPGVPAAPGLKMLPPWSPNRFLLGWCQVGRWSNRVLCMERALVLAALLNRTLIVPPLDVCSPALLASASAELIDIPHLRQCLLSGAVLAPPAHAGGAAVAGLGKHPNSNGASQGAGRLLEGVVSLEEFLGAEGLERVTVDMLLCLGKQGKNGMVCTKEECRAADRVTFPKAQRLPVDPRKGHWPWADYRPQDLAAIQRASEQAYVLCLADTYYSTVEPYYLDNDQITPEIMELFGSPCPLAVRPTNRHLALAEEFVRYRFGTERYAALHFRRGDFRGWSRSKRLPYWSVQQAADCIIDQTSASNLSTLFLATDAAQSEVDELKFLLSQLNITVATLGPRRRLPKGVLYFQEADIMDKLLCAKSALFLSTIGSTFSARIKQFRRGLGTSSPGDQVLCQGHNPHFSPKRFQHLKA